MTLDTKQVAIIEHALNTVFPDDCALVGDQRVHMIALDSAAAVEKQTPPLGGDKFDLMPILHDLKDVAELAIAVIALWRTTRLGNDDKKTDAGRVKNDVKKSIEDGTLKASETVLKKADALIDDVISSLQNS